MAGSTRWIYGIIGLALLSILFSAWELQHGSSSFVNFALSKDNDTELQLVVFGDSWSDNGIYQMDFPEPDVLSTKIDANSQVWTEHLCSAIACHHENYARPAVIEPGSADLIGVFVDRSLYAHDIPNDREAFQPQADLKLQVDQWTAIREGQAFSEIHRQQRDSSTIFVIQFGFWDIWSSTNKQKETAKYAVMESVDVIFSALDYLADSSENSIGVRVILALAPDISFLPGYSRNNQDQRHAVALTELWNTALTERAENWGRGEIYLYDINHFMLDHIRTHQLAVVGLSDAEGLGTQIPVFENVETACASVFETEMGRRETNCSMPEKYLFWDEYHLGSKAHELIATEILHDLRSQSGGWLKPNPDSSII